MFVKSFFVTFVTPIYPQEHMFCGNRPRKPTFSVETPSKPVENPVNVECRLPTGKPLWHKGFSTYPLVVEIAPTARSIPS
jgi:hypothetical protein